MGWHPDPVYDPPDRTRTIPSIKPAEDRERWEVRGVDIPGYFTVDFWQAVRIWAGWKQRGWPFSGGWAEQPSHIVEIVEALEEESQWRSMSSSS